MASIWLVYNYNYYDNPEGEAAFTKMFACGKWGFMTGMCLAVPDCVGYSNVRTWKGILNCTGYWVVPLTAMGISFAAVTYCATNIRQKDDKFNYFLGALASTGILHAWRRNFTVTCYGGVAMVAAALIKKHVVQQGYSFLPPAMKREVLKRRDFSVTPDPRYM